MWLKHYKLNDHEQRLVNMSREEFDEYMMSNYADMFKYRKAQEGQEVILPMNFGFEIGPGWRHVLDNLCHQLRVIQNFTGYICVFDQIKEKYGGARFYKHVELMDGKEPLPDEKIICDTIDNLVSMHEEYCDYICEEIGTNVRPKEKVKVGGWYYGMGIEGFRKAMHRMLANDSSSANSRIALAEKYLARLEKIEDINDKLYNLSADSLDKVNKIIDEIIKEDETR